VAGPFRRRVQRIAGQLMVVQPALGSSVSVDLVTVPQDEYAGLTAQNATGNVWSICPGLVRPKSRGAKSFSVCARARRSMI
jgi:hypothetical protein